MYYPESVQVNLQPGWQLQPDPERHQVDVSQFPILVVNTQPTPDDDVIYLGILTLDKKPTKAVPGRIKISSQLDGTAEVFYVCRPNDNSDWIPIVQRKE